MYAWIWRHLPFGLPGKLIGSLLLASAVVALLWYWVFPTVEPLLPFDDVNVTEGDPGDGAPPDDGVPYPTEEPRPTGSSR